MMLENTDTNIIKIRAHHLLCFQGFQGYGYNKDFIMKMEEILRILKSDPSPNIEIVTNADAVCSICPNLVEKECVDHLKIKKMDLNVIKSISLEENQILTFKTALQIIDDELSSEAIKTICTGCVWMDKCLFFINKIDSKFEDQSVIV
jgi:hypothetical protein